MSQNKSKIGKVSESDYPFELVGAMNLDLLMEDEFYFGSGGSGVFDQPGSILDSLSALEEEEDDESTENDSCARSSSCDGKSSGNSKKAKVDRTRTLISERKRRGRMKDKLYALRALVPNITKMDKASIVGDAVLYVQQLQMQAKKLKAEISDLESVKDRNTIHHNYKKNSISRIVALAPKTIAQMDVFRVEEREFYVRLQSNKGVGVVVSLYKAVESLLQFFVRSSNLTTVEERFILTFTLSVGDCQEEFDVASVKVFVGRALVSQGFGLTTAP